MKAKLVQVSCDYCNWEMIRGRNLAFFHGDKGFSYSFVCQQTKVRVFKHIYLPNITAALIDAGFVPTRMRISKELMEPHYSEPFGGNAMQEFEQLLADDQHLARVIERWASALHTIHEES